MKYAKFNSLLRAHRRGVFDQDGRTADRHRRALRRLKNTHAYRDLCRENDANARYRAGEAFARMGY